MAAQSAMATGQLLFDAPYTQRRAMSTLCFERRHGSFTIMQMNKKILFALYIAVAACMGVATIIEKYKGTDYVSGNIYGTWWFAAMWALLAATATIHFVGQHVRKPSSIALHLSFIIILAGALTTHLFAKQGMVHLRMGETTDKYYVLTANGEDVEERQLPFSIRLNKFDIKYHNGTMAVADYQTQFTITEDGKTSDGMVSMNNIYSRSGIRLYQSSYDEDQRGSILSMNNDPWGIGITYTGYALLFVSLLWMLLDPRGAFRQLLRNPLLKKGVLVLMPLLLCHASAKAANALPKATAEKFGELNILYNDRICPLQTFAIDFTKKLYGKASYKDYTAEQVLTGFMFWPDEWSGENMVRVNGGALKTTLQLPDLCSVNTFFNPTMGGYILGPYIQEYYQGQQDKFHKQAADIDDRLMLVMDLRQGKLLKVFPCTDGDATTWYAPGDKLPATIDRDNQLFIQNLFALLQQYAVGGDYAKVDDAIAKIAKYQQANGGNSMPTAMQAKAERIYNNVPFATILFMANLAVGLLALLLTIARMTMAATGGDNRKPSVWRALLDKPKTTNLALRSCMSLAWLALTLCLALRWTISGRIPMSNGYETMLFVAWLVMLLSLAVSRRFRIALPLGLIMSGFFLLVSHIGQMNPNITQVMPVLNSPLLSAHVSIIMLSFAMLSLTFICGAVAMLIKAVARRSSNADEQTATLALLSRLFLYPALAALGFGIFIGAIWANVSWGKYWGWDPKEVWALITFMVYAIAAHTATLPALRKPMVYHAFMVLAFISIIMTYFGVNYFLGGMHSYA